MYFSRSDSFDISGTTVAIPVEMGSINYARTLFEDYLGEENCYDILIFDGYLFIMLRGNKETRKKIRTDIHEIVTAGYEQPKGEKKIKLQKK